jgi:hypothetical protein
MLETTVFLEVRNSTDFDFSNPNEEVAVAEGESTLDSPQQLSKQATEQQELQNYVSFRMTSPKNWEELENVVDGFDWYISYRHIGKNGDNPHFHVAVPGAKAELERIRKRVKTAGLFGNKCFSGKPMQNSVLQFIQYASREETQPNIRGEVQQWIDAAPRWIQANLLDNLNIHIYIYIYISSCRRALLASSHPAQPCHVTSPRS